MTSILKYDKDSVPGQRLAGTSAMNDTRGAITKRGSRVLRAFSLFCSLLGYTIVLAVVVAGILELGARIFWLIHPTRQTWFANQRESPVYAGVDWAQQFWVEEPARLKEPRVYVPFRVWGVTKWHGKYINNDDGANGLLRRTINPTCNSSRRVNVWVFGGSTVYGTAVPDFATMPSYLSRELNVAGQDCVVVTNFGVEGYVTDQELILLEEQLKAGGRPDIVIFYDGVNDACLAWPPGPRDRHFSFSMLKARIEGKVRGRLDFVQNSNALRLVALGLSHFRSPSSFISLVAKTGPNVVATLDNYEANIRLVRALGEAYKFKIYCFWQPMLVYGAKPLVPFEQQMATRDARGDTYDSAWFLTDAAVFREAELHAAGDGGFVFLGHLFDSTREPLYVDEAHLGPRGNEMVAQAIANYVRTQSAK